jgi:inhibitor of cysteine peptidase
MARKLFSLVAAGVVIALAAIAAGPAAQAALCGKCSQLMFVDSAGTCSDCGAATSSGALKLCPKCSAKRHQCEHCLAPLTAQDEAPAKSDPPSAESRGADSHQAPSSGDAAPAGQSQGSAPGVMPSGPQARHDSSDSNTGSPAGSTAVQPALPAPPDTVLETRPPAELPAAGNPPATARPIDSFNSVPGNRGPATELRAKPINPANAGTYTAGKWRYQLQIASPGAANEGRWGWLSYDGQKLPRGEVNDYYNTPWGAMFWVDVPNTAWGLHGWMPIPLPQNRRHGRELALQDSLLGSAQTPPAAFNPATPASPRPQTLEVNKSHNGQLARLHVGNFLVIRLPGNPATGYQWQVASTTSPAVRLTVRPQYSPPATPAAPGLYTFIFQAVQPGAGAVRLYYARPNEPHHARDSFAVGVNVFPAAK